MNSERIESLAALLAASIGIAVTTTAAFTHTPQLNAPGAMLILLGGAWLGNALARHDRRLFGGDRPTKEPPTP